jgi:hypothetical protein
MAAAGLSVYSCLMPAGFCKLYGSFLRQPPPANKNFSSPFGKLSLQSLPHSSRCKTIRYKKAGLTKQLLNRQKSIYLETNLLILHDPLNSFVPLSIKMN